MKKVKSLILFLFVATLVSGQFDDRFYNPSKDIIAIDSIDYEDHYIYVDNDTVHYAIFYPETIVDSPTIFYFHGSGGNISQYVSRIKPFVEAGYPLVMIDFRGYGKSTGKPLHSNVAEDAQAIFDIVIQKDEIKDSKIIIYGASLGSQIATKMAKDNLTRVHALILDGGMSSFTDIAADSAPAEQEPMIRQYVTSPYSSKQDIRELGDLPTLIVHSNEDKDVVISHAEENFKNASGTKEMFIFQGEHLECTLVDSDRLIQKIRSIVK